MNILVIIKLNLGDVVMSTAAISLLKAHNPHAKVTVITTPTCVPFMEGHKDIDHVITEQLATNKFTRAFQKIKNIVARRSAQYDVCFFLGESAKTAMRYKLLTKIPDLVCAERAISGEKNKLAAHCNRVIQTQDVWTTHVVDYFQDIIRGYLKITTSARPSLPPVSPTLQKYAQNTLSEMADSSEKIALCFTGSPYSLNKWPEEKFAELVSQLHKSGLFVYTAIPPQHLDIANRIKERSGVDFPVICTKLEEAIALLQQSDLLLAVDTGQIHIAAALNIPVLALGGATAIRTYPYGRKGYLLSKANSCYECSYIADCPSNYKTGRKQELGYIPPCMHALTVNEVLQHTFAVLSKPEENKRQVLIS